jgi:hypothetical protein
MASLFLVLTSVCGYPAAPPAPRLNGAFIQFDPGRYALWTPQQWRATLDQMRAAGLNIVILQYLQARDGAVPATSESFVPEVPGAPDPVGVILDHADRHEMSVLIGLRLDQRLLGSVFLNDPNELRAALADELPRNVALAQFLAAHYRLKHHRSFGGWYLPLEFANFEETAPNPRDGWVSQLNGFTKALSSECNRLAPGLVAISPYFNGAVAPGSGLVDARQMGRNFARFLDGTDVSVVMLQDGVGVKSLPAGQVAGYVLPFLSSVKDACRRLSRPGREVEFWLNVESFTQFDQSTRVPADIGRLRKQIALGRAQAEKVVTFEFTHYLGSEPLYDEYLQLIRARSGR